VRAFANLTTKRLAQIRGLRKTGQQLKKKDVKLENLTQLLLLRQNALDMFAEEILDMDPQFTGFLSLFASGMDQPIEGPLAPNKEAVLEMIKDLLVKKGLYSSLQRTADQALSWEAHFSSFSDEALQKADIVRNFKQFIKDNSKVRHRFVKKRFLLDDLLAIQEQQQKLQRSKVKTLGPEVIKPPVGGTIPRPPQELLNEGKTRVEQVKLLDSIKPTGTPQGTSADLPKQTEEDFKKELSLSAKQWSISRQQLVDKGITSSQLAYSRTKILNRKAYDWNTVNEIKDFINCVTLIIMGGNLFGGFAIDNSEQKLATDEICKLVCDEYNKRVLDFSRKAYCFFEEE
jgi:hypothetical protein